MRISDHELVWPALPLFSSLGSIPLRTDGPGLFTTDYGFSSSCSVVWLTSYSSRVDSAMRGSSISFLTRARSAWLDSCLGWLLCILVRCHASKGITGQLGTALTVLELFFRASSFDVSGRLPVTAGLALDGHPRRAGLRCRCYHFTFSSPEDSNG